MENRKSDHPPAMFASLARAPFFHFLFSIFCFAALAGCGAPGEPRPRRPVIPAVVNDLAARQQGQGVVLTFTLPRNNVEGAPLETPPEVEIYRQFLPAGAKPGASPAPSSPAYTIPAALVDTYLAEGRVRFVDALKPEDLARKGEQVAYVVRTRVSKSQGSADSNPAAITLYPPPPPVRAPHAAVSQAAITLHWQPPEESATGKQMAALLAYRVYRAEVAPGAGAEAARNPAGAQLKTPLVLIGVTTALSYPDPHFEFGKTYLYIVRSVAGYETGAIESTDASPAVVTPRDSFPPAPPKDLVVVLIPAPPGGVLTLELSWAISPEPDVAGYNLYRSEQEGSRGQRQNLDLLITPTFRDMRVVAGRRYIYSVTAVDRAGNESLVSAAVSVAVPSEGANP